jgi:hypothetical protein
VNVRPFVIRINGLFMRNENEAAKVNKVVEEILKDWIII